MGKKALSFKVVGRWRLLALNRRLACFYIPLLILGLSVFSLFTLSPNPIQQSQSFDSLAHLANYHLIEGAVLGLGLFCILLAYYKKSHFYLVTATWTFCNLHLGSQMLGTDGFWLQLQLPPEYINYINQVVIGIYFVLSQQLLQIGLQLTVSNNKQNILLGLTALIVFILSLTPYSTTFSWVIAIAIPLALILALSISLTQLFLNRAEVFTWHILLLSMLVSGLISYFLSLVLKQNELLNTFNAFVFLILSSAAVVIGIMGRIKNLVENKNELRSTYQNSPFSVLKIDFDGNILHSNRAFRRLCSKLQISRPRFWNAMFPEQNWKHIVRHTQSGKYIEIQSHNPGQINAPKPLFALYANTIPEGYVLTLQDITLYTNTLNRLKSMADNDPVTQVLNQRGFEKALQYAIDNLNNHQPCFLAYLDVNHVSQVNRVYGHAAGDALLQEVSQRIGGILKQRHSFGRISSDEFAFLLTNTSTEEATTIAQKITSLLNNAAIETPYRNYELNVSLGLIEVGKDMDEHAALRTAHAACVAAGQSDTGFVLYEHNSKEMQYRTEELELFEHLENGTTGSLFIEMQPLLNLKDPLASLNVEVLLRVRRKNGELIPLHTFIPAAEENGTISVIDKWIFTASLNWLNTNYQLLDKTRQLNVNLSGSSLNNDKFITELFELLDKHESLLHKLCVEITEGVALQNLDRTRDFMVRLQKKGVQIALDDFGAGYTSFSYLRELPANAIKIDGALIKDMLSKESNIAIVRTIVELARNLGMRCVAEWVEDVETLATLKEMGVDYAQGFAISRSCNPSKILTSTSILDVIDSPETIRFITEN